MQVVDPRLVPSAAQPAHLAAIPAEGESRQHRQPQVALGQQDVAPHAVCAVKAVRLRVVHLNLQEQVCTCVYSSKTASRLAGSGVPC